MPAGGPPWLDAIVARLRADPRAALPHQDAAETLLGRRFPAVEVHRGAAAADLCATLDARAFSVGHVIAFAEPAPSLARVVHELAHVVQQGAAEHPVTIPHAAGLVVDRASAAEREATQAARGEPVRFSAAPVRLYRDEGDTDPDTLTTAVEQRLYKAMVAARAGGELAVTTYTADTAPIGIRDGDWFRPIFKVASKPWNVETYARAVEVKDGSADLAKAFDKPADSTRVELAARGFVFEGKPLRLARVAEVADKRHIAYAFVGDSDVDGVAAPWQVRVQDMRSEQRLRLFARDSDLKLGDVEVPVFGIRGKDDKVASTTFKRSSPKEIQAAAYVAFLRTRAGLIADGSAGDAEAAADLAKFREPAFLKRGVPAPGGRAYLVPIKDSAAGTSSDAKNFFYALLAEPRDEVQFADPERQREKTSPAGMVEVYKVTILAGLRKILDGTTKDIGGKPTLALDDEPKQKLLAMLDELDKLVAETQAAITLGATEPTKAPSDSALEAVAEKIRHTFVKACVDNYDDVAVMHQHLGVSKIFIKEKDPKVKDDKRISLDKVRGTILEDWVGKHYPIVQTDPTHIPVFGKKDGNKLVQSEALQQVRRGDGKIIAKGQKKIIFEAKFVTAAPSDEHTAQMKDYAMILGYDASAKAKVPPMTGWFYNPAEKDPAKKWFANTTWDGILYVFSDAGQKDGWQAALKENFGPLFKTKVWSEVAGSTSLEQLLTSWTENPTIELTIKKPGDRTSFTFPPFDAPEPKLPGVVFTEVKLELYGPGDPVLKSGTVKTAVDPAATKGVVSSPAAPDARPIVSLSESERVDLIGAPKPTGGKPRTYGRIKERIGGLKSKLDDLLKRVKTSAKLIDGGLEASVEVEPGASGIPKFKLTKASVVVTVGKAAGKSGLGVKGEVGLEHESGKIAGGVTISYKDGLVIEGTATVKDVVEGLKPFTVSVKYAPPAEEGGQPEVAIGCKEVAFEKRYRGVLITGKSTDLSYDVTKGTFSGNGSLTADLGPFGKASVEKVAIVENKVDSATFSYEAPALAWPKKNPTLSLGVKGTATYDQGAFSGSLDLSAKITHKHLKKLNPELESIALSGNLTIAKDGATSGFIKTDSIIPLGKHFQIPALKIAVTADGELSAAFTVDLINIETKWVTLQEASLSCVIDRDGFRVTKGRLAATVGGKGKKFSGTLVAAYDPESGFTLGAEVDVEIKPGLVAHGTLTYSSKTNKVSGSLSTKPITLLDKSDAKEIFRLVKQIRLFGIPFVVGVYLDVGVVFNFNYGFKLTVAPLLELIGFSLDTFAFEEARAQMTLGGELWAELVPTPQIGLGAYLIDPIVMRGGGGLRIPISAKARLLPTGTFLVSYKPDGGLNANVDIGLSLRFGITASVEPYAEFVLLDGLYTAPWKGSPLTTFTILPERELFSFNINFGKPLTKTESPELASKSQAPAEAAKGTKQGGETKQEGSKPVKEEPMASRPGVEPSSVKDEPPADQEGFSMKTLVAKLMDTPPGKAVKAMIETVKEAYEFIKGIVGKIWRAIKGFVGDAIDAFTDFVKGIRKEGLFGYIKILLKRHLDETLFFCIEPVLDVFVSAEDKLLSIFTDAASDPFTFALQIVQKLFGVAWSSLTQLVSAIKTMFGRGKQALGRWLNYLVQNGKLGVLRHEYYIGSKWLGVTKDFLAPDQYKVHVGWHSAGYNGGSTLIGIDSGIAIGLWAVLELFSEVQRTDNPSEGSHTNYWTGDTSEGRD